MVESGVKHHKPYQTILFTTIDGIEVKTLFAKYNHVTFSYANTRREFLIGGFLWVLAFLPPIKPLEELVFSLKHIILLTGLFREQCQLYTEFSRRAYIQPK